MARKKARKKKAGLARAAQSQGQGETAPNPGIPPEAASGPGPELTAEQAPPPPPSAELIGYVAVSPTAAAGLKAYVCVPGFDETGPQADLYARCEGDDNDWVGFAVLGNEHGVRFERVGEGS